MFGRCQHYWDAPGRCHNQTRYFSGRMGNHDWHAQWRVLEGLVASGALSYHPPTQAAAANEV